MPPRPCPSGSSRLSRTSTVSFSAKNYLAIVVVCGLGILGHSITNLIRVPLPSEWLVFAALSLLSGAFNIKVPSIPARLSVSEAFVFATVLLYGRDAATVVVALDATVMTLRRRTDRNLSRAPFNVAAAAVSIWVSAWIFGGLRGSQGLADGVALNGLLLPLFGLALSYFLLNSGLVAFAMSRERGGSAFELWRRNFLWFSLNYIGGASFAALMVSYRPQFDLTIVAATVPLMVITYLTFRTSLGRLEDANRHVEQVNELYLSTIETLAMAVDAKDQITHGHIRRVQVYATELARRLGVNDETQLRAIKAAALLHDMGKLAIPEDILNKPGRLSVSEFETMKQHADIGADLLSAIRFPYPVVPIVRHHHEQWNGLGYPSGIAKTDIPLGARILSVVDCFDALTSDRPYRPRLSSEEAFQVLRERRGSVYDPLVVDTFVLAYGEIAPLAIEASQLARRSLGGDAGDTSAGDVGMPLRRIRANAGESSLLCGTRSAISQSSSSADAFESVAQYVRKRTPATVCALFRPGAQDGRLYCLSASGQGAEFLLGLSIGKGERITGWVAEKGQAILNSDPVLDLGRIADSFQRPLRSAMSDPICVQDRCIGVITLYSSNPNAFSAEDQIALHEVLNHLAERLDELDKGATNPITSVTRREV